MQELLNKRGYGHRHYRQDDGSILTVIQNGQCHPRNGRFNDPDTWDLTNCYLSGGNTEVSDSDTGEMFTHQTGTHPCDIRFNKFKQPMKFKARSNGDLIVVRAIGGANVTGVKSVNKVSYEQVWPGIDCIREVTPEGIKSTYIKTAPIDSISFDIWTNGCDLMAYHRRPVWWVPGQPGQFGLVPFILSGNTLTYDISAVPVGAWIDPTVTLQPAAGIDSWIYSALATTNFGTDDRALGGDGTSGSSVSGRPLIKFDISSIPAGSTIDLVTLSLWEHDAVTDYGGPDLRAITLRRLLRDWTEAGVTWNTYDGTNSWTTAGAGSDGNDRSATVSALRSDDGTAAGAFVAWTDAQLITDVQNWLDGTWNNYGWLMLNAGEFAGAVPVAYNQYRSSDWTTAGERPKLTVDYTSGAASINLPLLGVG